MRLEDRTAIVTGASSAIGRAIALRFAEEGANVVVSDVREDPIWDPDDMKPTADLITARGGEAQYIEADVSQWEDVDHLVTKTIEAYGRLDVLVNNAAVFYSTSILETSEEDWDSLMAVNLRGVFLACKRAIAEMINQPARPEVRGRIVNISSQHGVVGPPETCAYAVSKGGVIQLTRQLAVDFGRQGIIVNAVAPARIITGTHPGEREFLSKGEIEPETEANIPIPNRISYSRSRTPFYRLGRPTDVANAALFLASDECSYTSGHNLLVDGGWIAF